MFAPDDTIVAIATPAGRGGLGVVRLSGPRATSVASGLLRRSAALAARQATFARLTSDGGVGDEVIATWFPAPRSYTGEDVVEISAHGSPVVLQGILRRAQEGGARLAAPGEFTLRAFLNGKRDLVQAEAVADLIDAATPLQARVACDQLEGTLTRRLASLDAELFDLIARLEASLDFPDEGYHFIGTDEVASAIDRVIADVDGLLTDARAGRLIREGATVVVAGRPNVGKSSLFNALLGGERAIVTDRPGTTRDVITERVDLDGVPVTLVDTAGERDTADPIEREGVRRGGAARQVADLVLLVLDASEGLTIEDHRLLGEMASERRLLVMNKCDCAGAWTEADLAVARRHPAAETDAPVLRISARTGEGLSTLRARIIGALTGGETLRDTATITNLRHIRLLEEARESLERARDAAARERVPEEFVLSDLQAARVRFDEVVGRRTDEDVLRHIFDRFCIGK